MMMMEVGRTLNERTVVWYYDSWFDSLLFFAAEDVDAHLNNVAYIPLMQLSIYASLFPQKIHNCLLNDIIWSDREMAFFRCAVKMIGIVTFSIGTRSFIIIWWWWWDEMTMQDERLKLKSKRICISIALSFDDDDYEMKWWFDESLWENNTHVIFS